MRYDVRCEGCGKQFEISKRMVDALPVCKCGGKLVQVMNAAPAVVFAGTGFYNTDYKRFESQVGSEAAAKFRHKRDDIMKRASQGRLTAYEKALE